MPSSAAGSLRRQGVRALRSCRRDEGKDQGAGWTATIAPAVANGEAELGVFLTNVLIAPGDQLAGPFPAELQQELVFTAAVATDPGQADAAKALIDYLKTPDAKPRSKPPE